MAKRDKSGRDSATPPQARGGQLRTTLVALLGLQAIALGLKAWDDRNISNANARAAQDQTSRLIAERLESRSRLVLNAMELSARSGASLSIMAGATPEVEQILPLVQAARSDDPRIQSATRTATRLLAAGQLVGVSSEGDIVVAVSVTGAGELFAITPATDWLPLPRNNQKFSLIGDTEIVLGNPTIARGTSISENSPQITLNGTARTVSACSPVDRAEMTVCTARPLPLIETADLARLGFYLLLLLGPALAIFGLTRELQRQIRSRTSAEQAHEKSETMTDLIMQASHAGYWEWDESSELIRVSQGIARLNRQLWKPEITGRELLETVFEPDRDQVRKAIIDSRQSGMVQATFRTHHSQGHEWHEIRGRRVRESETDTPRFIGIIVDVTERMNAEIRLRTTEQRLRIAIEGFNGPFALWDKRKRLVVWNSAFSRDFGVSDVLREGVSHEAVTLASRPAIRIDREAHDESRAREICLRDGRWLKLIERVTPDGGTMTLGIDITGNIQAQENLSAQREKFARANRKLEQSEAHAAELARKYQDEKTRAEQASKSKSAFLANVSHELRTPLNAINGFSAMLVNQIFGPLGDSRYQEYASDILNSGEHLLEMINDILDMSKIEAGRMTISTKPIDPVDPVDAAVRMMRHRAEEQGVRLTLEAGELPPIEADHRAVRQMMLNLISNAVKFTDSGGRVAVMLSQRDRYVRIAVRDTGIGISKEHISRLGRPFEQVQSATDRNYEGTGLGLALTKSFAEMHGGRLSIASEPGRGTLVAIYLPIADEARLADPHAIMVEQKQTISEDDDDDILETGSSET